MNKKIADRIIRRLCEKLDEDVYMPVNYELGKHMISHTLGIRKEEFKLTIERIVNISMKDVSHCIEIEWISGKVFECDGNQTPLAFDSPQSEKIRR